MTKGPSLTSKKRRILFWVIISISGVAAIFLNGFLRADHSLTITILSILSIAIFVVACILASFWERQEQKKK